MTWQAIIQRAASTRFARAGVIDAPFKLARRDLWQLVQEISGWPRAVVSEQGYMRIQVRVYVPELETQVFVDEWVRDASPAPVLDSAP